MRASLDRLAVHPADIEPPPRALGVRYLHPMPLPRARPGENDGGHAVQG